MICRLAAVRGISPTLFKWQVFTKGIVQVEDSGDLVDTDGAVTAARDDLTTVGGDGDAVHDLPVSRETTVFGHSLGVPEPHGPVPTAREGKRALGREDGTGQIA